jgi:hypothetical protein
MAEKNGTAASAVRPPEGLARVGSVTNAPWWSLEPGNVLHGILENVYERPDERSKSGKSKFFQIRTVAATKVRYGRGKQAKVGVCKAGDVINLNYGPKTKELEKFVSDIMRGAEYTVWCHVDGEKFDIGKGQTMWPIDVRAGQTRAPTISDEPDFEGVEDEADEAPAATAT